MIPPLPPDWKCPRRVGFLFPHECRRMSPLGCPDCQNGQVDDPYHARTDRFGYNRYGYYDDDYFFDLGPSFAAGGVPDAGMMDFTEADGADLVQPGDDFENDMTES